MADGLNRVIFLGNLGADPELKMLAGGNAVLKLRIAASESYMDRSNTRQEKTEWASATVWGKRAEGLAKILKKGDRVCVEGSLHTSSSEKDGQKRYFTEITVREVILCGGGGGDPTRGAGGATRGSRGPSTPAPAADTFGASGGEFDDGSAGGDDEIPF